MFYFSQNVVTMYNGDGGMVNGARMIKMNYHHLNLTPHILRIFNQIFLYLELIILQQILMDPYLSIVIYDDFPP